MEYKYNAVEVGKRIKAIRKGKMTQGKLAEFLLLSIDSVSNFENGKSMCMPEHVAKICTAFDVTSDYIYYGREQVKQSKEKQTERIVESLAHCDAEELEYIEKLIILLSKK